MIGPLIKKLRLAADVLEDLLYDGTSHRKLAARLEKALPPVKSKKPKPVHWTQRPENAAQFRQWKKTMTAKAKAARARKRKEKLSD